jgi:STE24 endopeptidase
MIDESSHQHQLEAPRGGASGSADVSSEQASAAVPDAVTDSDRMSAEQLAEAKQYGRQKLSCDLADRALDLIFLAAMATLVARPLDDWLSRRLALDSAWLRLAALFLLLLVFHIGVSFPLAFYCGHVLEHRYGLSRQSFGRWLWRYAKRNLLAAGLVLLMVEGLYAVIWLTGEYWWLVAAAAFFAVSVLLGQLAPVLILPLFYQIRRLEDGALAERLARLAEGTGLTLEGVYRMVLSVETVKANAMLAGLGRTRRVILGDTLLDGFSPEEIEVIFAHEIGHHVHHHIRKMMLAGLAYSALSFLACDRLLVAWVTRIEGTFEYASVPVYTLPMVMLAVTVLSMLFEPLQNAVSRYFERQSDWYALTRTGRTDAYRSAFEKLARLNKADPDPHRLEVLLFHSHPTISARLAMAGSAARERTKDSSSNFT